ncbi:MAG: hypothetical protein ABL921_24340, partial [Pirellula sp.]
DEGLLSMTVPKVVSIRLGAWLPHAKPPDPADESLLDGLLQFCHHGQFKGKFQGLMQIVRAAWSQRNRTKKNGSRNL